MEESLGSPPSLAYTFEEVFEQRRTQRMLKPATLEQVCGLIRLICRARGVRGGRDEQRMLKPVVSAGALHVLDIVIAGGPDLGEPLVFHDASDSFLRLEVAFKKDLATSIERLQAFVPSALGHVIVYAAHLERLRSGYTNPMSLLFRDAGAVDQILSMSAFATGFAFVPFGTSANDAVTAIRGSAGGVVGAGSGVLGLPSD